MKIIPTVNIQNSSAVPIFGKGAGPCDPVEIVDFVIAQGSHRLALVDVDAARGSGHNRDLIARLMQRFHKGVGKACIQVGGGIRSSDQAQFFLDNGAAWLLVGTILHRSPLVVDQLLARFRENLTASLDARGGEILSSGWKEPAPMKPETAGTRIRGYGFKRVLFMDVPTGPSVQPDFETAKLIANSSKVSMFMGGSILCQEHLDQALEMPNLHGLALDALLLRDGTLLNQSQHLLRI